MADETLAKLHERLEEAREKRRRATQRMEKAQADMEDARADELAITRTLQSIGEAVPEDTTAENASREVIRRGGRVRAEDAALEVVESGEEVSQQEVANRVAQRGIAFASQNPANALATAMSRSRLFVKTGRGRFRRREPPKLVQSSGEDSSVPF